MSLFELRKAIESQMASIDLSVQTKSITALLQLFSESLLSGVNQVDSYDRHSRTLVKLAPYYLFDNRGNHSEPSFHRPISKQRGLSGFQSLYTSLLRVKRSCVRRHSFAGISPNSIWGSAIIIQDFHACRNNECDCMICNQFTSAVRHRICLNS